MDESREPVGDFDCPSLLCEELEGVEENSHGDNKTQDEEDGERGGEREREGVRERTEREWGGREKQRGGDVVRGEGDETDAGVEVDEGEGQLGEEEEEKEGEEETNGVTIDEGGVHGGHEGMEEGTVERSEGGESDACEAAVTEKGEEEDMLDFQKGDEQMDGKAKTFWIDSEGGDVKEVTWCGVDRDGGETERKFDDEILLELTSVNPEGLAESSAVVGPSCDLSDSGYLSCEPGLYCPPGPLLYPPTPQPQPSPSGTSPPPSSHPDLPPPPPPQHLQVKVTQVYATRHSVHFRARRRRGQAPPFPMLPVVTVAEPTDPALAPQPKKKTRTLYSMDQLEQLESMFQEEHYPDAEKRKEIAATVCVTPQRIMVWFQNRRAKWRKLERSSSAKPEHKQSRKHRGSPRTGHYPLLAPLDPLTRGATFSGNIAPAPPPPAAPLPSPPCSLPSYSALLASLQSPAGRGAGPAGHQSVPQGGHGASVETCPPPMVSPPPLRRASLPLFGNYNPLNTAAPLHNPPAPAPASSSFFLDMLEGSSSLPHPDPPAREPQGLSLQTESGSLFDYGESLGHQSGSLSYQLQPSYQAQNHSQAHSQNHSQAQAQASLPRLAYLNPSPYLPPNPSESNPTSYLTFGSGGGGGVVTYGGGGPAYFQSQSGGQIVLQSGPHGGIAAYQTYPWAEVYSQPGMFQRASRPQYTSRDHVTATTTSSSSSYPYTASVPNLLPHRTYPRGGHGPSHPQRPTASAMSAPRPPFSRADSALPKVGPPLVPHVSPALPEPPLEPPCLKEEYDSPREVHSHFQCDFSPIHF